MAFAARLGHAPVAAVAAAVHSAACTAARVGGAARSRLAVLEALFGLVRPNLGSSIASLTLLRPYSSAAWGENQSPALPPVPQPEGGSGGAPFHRIQLVRDFIHDSLYHPEEGYFCKHNASGAGVVGTLPQPLDFNSFAGQTEYLLAVKGLYQQLQASWLTPVEIFQPHYGRAIANCILQRWHQQAASTAAAGQPTPPLHIYEIGGGTGTLARNVLDWLRSEHPATYARTQYACVEISPVLAAIQQRKVAAEGGHAAHFTVRQHDAADAAGWEAADAAAHTGSSPVAQGSGGGHAFIVMCEVLDNLPHDRVTCGEDDGEWHETLVAEAWQHHGQADAQGGSGALFELTQPASDPLVYRCLQALQAREAGQTGGSSGSGGGRGPGSWGRSGLALSVARAWRRVMGAAAEEVCWLPTGCVQLLDTLMKARPSHTLIAADFNQLPEVTVAGVNAPLVASTHGGATCDHGSYLVPRGSADIFFPTDFELLCALYRQAAATAVQQHSQATSCGNNSGGGGSSSPVQVAAEHMGTANFMGQHAPDLSATRTRSGYNPLMEDYTNTAFFVGSRARQHAWPNPSV